MSRRDYDPFAPHEEPETEETAVADDEFDEARWRRAGADAAEIVVLRDDHEKALVAERKQTNAWLASVDDATISEWLAAARSSGALSTAMAELIKLRNEAKAIERSLADLAGAKLGAARRKLKALEARIEALAADLGEAPGAPESAEEGSEGESEPGVDSGPETEAQGPESGSSEESSSTDEG